MTPIEFKGCNVTYGKGQKEYRPLPACVLEKEVVTCWKLSFREAVKLLFSRRVWLSQLTFGNSLQPVFMSVEQLVKYDKEG